MHLLSLTHAHTQTRVQEKEFTNKAEIPLLLQNLAYIADAADGELVVVEFVP